MQRLREIALGSHNETCRRAICNHDAGGLLDITEDDRAFHITLRTPRDRGAFLLLVLVGSGPALTLHYGG